MLQFIGTLLLITQMGNAAAQKPPLRQLPINAGYARLSTKARDVKDRKSFYFSKYAFDGKPETFAQTDINDREPWLEYTFGEDDDYRTTVERIWVEVDRIFPPLDNVQVTLDDKKCRESETYLEGQMYLMIFDCSAIGTKLRIELVNPGIDSVLTINEVKAWGITEPLPGKKVQIDFQSDLITKRQSSTHENKEKLYGISRSVDGDKRTYSQTAANGSYPAYWEADLDSVYEMKYIQITGSPAHSEELLEKATVTVNDKLCGGRLVRSDYRKDIWTAICRPEVAGNRVRIQLEGGKGILALAEVNAGGYFKPSWLEKYPKIEFPANVITTQSSTYEKNETLYGSNNAVDGKLDTFAHTLADGTKQPYWEVDLGKVYQVKLVKIHNRPGFLERLKNVVVTVDGKACGEKQDGLDVRTYIEVLVKCEPQVEGSRVRIQLQDSTVQGILNLVEVEVYGYIMGSRPEEYPKIEFPADVVTSQSSTYVNNDAYSSNKAIDGDLTTFSHTDANYWEKKPYWQVDLGKVYQVKLIKIYNRPGFFIRLRTAVATVDGKQCGEALSMFSSRWEKSSVLIYCQPELQGQVVKIQLQDAQDYGILNLPEVEVFGYIKPNAEEHKKIE